jgi:hypothetical protein
MHPPIIGKTHGVAAFVLFARLSLFPLVLFQSVQEQRAPLQVVRLADGDMGLGRLLVCEGL